MQPVCGQPVDRRDVALVCPPNRYKQIMKQGLSVTKKDEAPNPNRNAHPYDRAVEELGPRDPADPGGHSSAAFVQLAGAFCCLFKVSLCFNTCRPWQCLVRTCQHSDAAHRTSHHSHSLPVMLAEIKEEAVNLVVARVAFAENLKQVC